MNVRLNSLFFFFLLFYLDLTILFRNDDIKKLKAKNKLAIIIMVSLKKQSKRHSKPSRKRSTSNSSSRSSSNSSESESAKSYASRLVGRNNIQQTKLKLDQAGTMKLDQVFKCSMKLIDHTRTIQH